MFGDHELLTAVCFVAGALLGAWWRYGIGAKLEWLWKKYGWVNFILTMLGSVCMGFVCLRIFVDRWFFANGWHLFVCLGVMGGYLFYGSVAYGPLFMFVKGRPVAAGLQAGGCIAAGLLAAAGGALLGRLLL